MPKLSPAQKTFKRLSDFEKEIFNFFKLTPEDYQVASDEVTWFYNVEKDDTQLTNLKIQPSNKTLSVYEFFTIAVLAFGRIMYVTKDQNKDIFIIVQRSKPVVSFDLIDGKHYEHNYFISVIGDKIYIDSENSNETYSKYGDKIDESVMFSIVDFIALDKRDVGKSPDITKIKNLLREAKLLDENRGKIKRGDDYDTNQQLRKFLIKEAKTIKNGTRSWASILLNRLTTEVNRLFPNDAEKAEKYTWSESTIRRIVKPVIKK